jgi:asparagine synthase (glutamine-hydrolysing)
MCGIAGQARSDGQAPETRAVERMCAQIEHRGPDSRGVHADERAAIGIQRLRVIDLATGDQPIFNEDRTVAVVLNGEIYNFRELRQELEARGHRFATRADTEVIVHLYEERGVDCLDALNGMFGLAIWDSRRGRLVLARDRLGKKPLYYSLHDGNLSFASELAALMADPEVPRAVDHQALDAYLAYRWVPGPLTAFSAVRKLQPGHRLVYEGGRATVERWWRLEYTPKRAVTDERELAEEIRERIVEATRRRMISDVPLGAFLSGGIDSSAVVAAMAQTSSTPVRTFSIGFSHDDYNELPRARLIAERFGTEHHEFVVEPDAVSIVPKIVRHHGEPFADASAIPSFYLAEMTRRHVTVALNGDGGDESFGGYTRYVSNVGLGRADRLPAGLRRILARAGAVVPASGRIDSARSRARRMSRMLAMEPVDRYTAYMTSLNGLDRSRLYTPEYRALVGDSAVDGVIGAPWRESSADDPLDRLLDVDVATYLPDDLLTKIDIASMAYSLEARSPLLDYEFMQFAASLPASYKVRGREKKVGLRAALRDWLPDEILDGRKMGFRAPLAEWFRGDLREMAHDILLDDTTRARGWFDTDYVADLLGRHVRGEADNAQGIWTLLNFELWHRQLVDAPAGAEADLIGSARDG